MAQLLQSVPPLPQVDRGAFCSLATDAAGERVIYCNGSNVIWRALAPLADGKGAEKPDDIFCWRGHTKRTTCAAMSPNSQWVVSGDIGGAIRIWGAKGDHVQKNEFKLWDGSVKDASWSGDSTRIVAAGDGKEVRAVALIWDTGSKTGEVSGHTKQVNSIAFRSQRPFRVVTGGEDMLVAFHEGPPFKFKRSHNEHSNFVNSVRYSPDGDWVVSGGSDSKVCLYTGKDGDLVKEFTKPAGITGSIWATAWSPDSSRVVTAGGDKKVRVWDRETGAQVSENLVGSGALYDQQVGVAWPTATRIISVCLDGRLILWDVAADGALTLAATVDGTQGPLTCLTCDAKTGTLMRGGNDGSVAITVPGQPDRHIHIGKTIQHVLAHGGNFAGPAEAVAIAVDDCVRRISLESGDFLGEPIEVKESMVGVGWLNAEETRLIVATGKQNFHCVGTTGVEWSKNAVFPREPTALASLPGSPGHVAVALTKPDGTVGGVESSQFDATDYIDALLDDSYMTDLIEHTNQRMNKRAAKMEKYLLLQKLIFWFLVAQALLGIWVALYKWVLQPDELIGSNAEIENVDIVLMLDASALMGHAVSLQHNAAAHFRGLLSVAMLEHKKDLKNRERAKLEEEQRRKIGPMGRLFPFIRHFKPRQARPMVKVRGGHLQVATGVFNAEGAKLLHGLTSNFQEQEEALESLPMSSYQAVSFWYSALQLCKETVGSLDRASARYCAIIGDDSAMCSRVTSKPVDKACGQWGHGYCPSAEEMRLLGDSYLEYSHELEKCTTFVREELVPPPAEMKTILMFTVGSEEEGQTRLKNPSFQQFIQQTTDCEIKKNTTLAESSDGDISVVERFEYDEGCVRFIMGSGFDDLMRKSARIADLLKGTVNEFNVTNEGRDPRYLFFLLLPLNLLFYMAWSKILRWTNAVKSQAEKAMGKKKKVIKVTKFLVEKPEPDAALQQRRDQLSEVEMAEMASLQPMFEFGAPMLLRARLKGGYLHADQQQGGPDCNGHSSDPSSNWTFEPAGDGEAPEGAERPGCRVRIRSARGELLCADEAGVRFLAPPRAGEPPGADAAAAGGAAEFVLEHAEGEAACRLGDVVQLRACGTGRYLRVQRDGSCNAEGEAAQHETQIVIDRGGPAISSGSIVTLSSAVSGAFVRGTPDGAVTARPGREEWRFWKLERRGGAGSGSGDAAPGASAAAPQHANLKEGDIVTLRGFNQHMLGIHGTGAVSCGGAASSPGLRESGEEDIEGSARPSTDGAIQEFAIERVGMGLVRKHDQSIRAGMQVCLRPVQQAGAGSDDHEATSDYLRVDSDGSVCADGKVTQREIALTIDSALVRDMVLPLHSALEKGDVDILVSPLWNKSDIKKLNAMTSNWTNDEDLGEFKGPVVVASEKGTYAIPKAKGVDSGWVAVVNEGVDIPKAARQAKLQGATGLIVRCEEVLSLEKMRKAKGEGTPELPAVFVDKTTGEALDERGIVLNGCEFRRRYVTEAVRALGSTSHADGVFEALGKGMLERTKEREEEADAEAQNALSQAVPEEEEGNYKWKVTSNTHYLWGKSGGGAAVMNVNFGKAAPPSAVQRTKAYADASGTRARRPSAVVERRSMTGVAVLDPEDMKSRRLVSELSHVLRTEEVRGSEPLEQLAEESDFKIEYKFEELEVAAGEQLEEVEEQEIMEESEAVIAKFGVPQRMFWLVAIGLLASTTLLIGILCHTLFSEYPPRGDDDMEEEPSLAAWSTYGPWLEQARLGSFLSPVRNAKWMTRTTS